MVLLISADADLLAALATLPFAEPLVVASECRIVEIDLDSHRERLAIQRGGHTIP
jgi:hypothetical protein